MHNFVRARACIAHAIPFVLLSLLCPFLAVSIIIYRLKIFSVRFLLACLHHSTTIQQAIYWLHINAKSGSKPQQSTSNQVQEANEIIEEKEKKHEHVIYSYLYIFIRLILLIHCTFPNSLYDGKVQVLRSNELNFKNDSLPVHHTSPTLLRDKFRPCHRIVL